MAPSVSSNISYADAKLSHKDLWFDAITQRANDVKPQKKLTIF